MGARVIEKTERIPPPPPEEFGYDWRELRQRTTEEIPSGAPKEEFVRMIFKKKIPWGTVLSSATGARGGGVALERVTPLVYYTITAAQSHSSLYKGAVQNSP